MSITDFLMPEAITDKAKKYFEEEHAKMRLDGWFRIREIVMEHEKDYMDDQSEVRAAKLLRDFVEYLPLSVSEHAIFAGTQDDAFARSYALINPAFEVESFSGYCDPTAVFDDIEANEEFPQERIDKVREYTRNSAYVDALTKVYDKAHRYTEEAAFFIEQVTGHVIPDFRPALKYGVNHLISEIDERLSSEKNEKKRGNLEAMKLSLQSAKRLAERYREIVISQMETAGEDRKKELSCMADALKNVPANGATGLFEAIQSFLLLWEVMCMEQSPNPFAFSVGNADRIFEPYRKMDGMSRDAAAALFKHFLVFYNVADRSWAISQNVLLGGRDVDGSDLTNEMSYAILDAYFDMNLPQPILSVKLHQNTPDKLYREMGRFMFSPGCLTPSFFNDDALFKTLKTAGVDEADLPDYSVAGCQEPLIMGRDNANTTNSWLNLAKILELTLNGGVSTLSGKEIGDFCASAEDAKALLSNIRDRFYTNTKKYIEEMVNAANGASRALSLLPVPFLSAFMGGIETGIDMRDPEEQGTKYNGSGCLIHGLSIVADSFAAIDALLETRPEDSERMLKALRTNFENDEEMRQFLVSAPKYGNNIASVDKEAGEIASRVSDMVAASKNYLGNNFRPDWASPSTHLLYGYQVGATPDGRKAREMLGYGIDPLYGEADSGLGFRILSALNLPFEKMNGGYASHFGVDPHYFTADDFEGKGMEFKSRIIMPLFFGGVKEVSPSYLYVNVTTPETLRKVLENPKKYAPSGVYIMRIHGTFVNFLDLSPAIQQDIIKRLDLKSTAA